MCQDLVLNFITTVLQLSSAYHLSISIPLSHFLLPSISHSFSFTISMCMCQRVEGWGETLSQLFRGYDKILDISNLKEDLSAHRFSEFKLWMLLLCPGHWTDHHDGSTYKRRLYVSWQMRTRRMKYRKKLGQNIIPKNMPQTKHFFDLSPRPYCSLIPNTVVMP